MKKDNINLIPFSDEELIEMQTTLVNRMVELNQEQYNDDTREDINKEITTLGNIVNKVSRRKTNHQDH